MRLVPRKQQGACSLRNERLHPWYHPYWSYDPLCAGNGANRAPLPCTAQGSGRLLGGDVRIPALAGITATPTLCEGCACGASSSLKLLLSVSECHPESNVKDTRTVHAGFGPGATEVVVCDVAARAGCSSFFVLGSLFFACGYAKILERSGRAGLTAPLPPGTLILVPLGSATTTKLFMAHRHLHLDTERWAIACCMKSQWLQL